MTDRRKALGIILLGLAVILFFFFDVPGKVVTRLTVEVKDDLYFNKRYGYGLKIPTAWSVDLFPDDRQNTLVIYKVSERSARSPLMTIGSEDIYHTETFDMSRQIKNEIKQLKSESEYYRDLAIKEKIVVKDPRFASVGVLSYTFDGNLGGWHRFRTKDIYVLNGDLMVTLRLSDFDKSYRTHVKALDAAFATLRFSGGRTGGFGFGLLISIFGTLALGVLMVVRSMTKVDQLGARKAAIMMKVGIGLITAALLIVFILFGTRFFLSSY